MPPIKHAHSGIRFNEGKADPFGRWITGSMNLTTEEPDGAIYSLTAAGGARVLRGGFGVANGFEWNPAGTRMYFTDTSVETIYVGDYSDSGELSHVEVFHTGEAHDGLTMDADGHLWSGIYGGGKVIRYAPDGTVDQSIAVPVPNVTSVAFGGPDLSTLFIATARENLTEEQLEVYPLSGAVFAVDTTTHGYLPRIFDADFNPESTR
jgi:sugar lactone lactonase YvrE